MLQSVLEIVEQGEPYIGVVGDRVVQVDRKDKAIRDAGAVKVKFDVEPVPIPDWLALVGDAADGFSGIAGLRRLDAARRCTAPARPLPRRPGGARRVVAASNDDRLSRETRR